MSIETTGFDSVDEGSTAAAGTGLPSPVAEVAAVALPPPITAAQIDAAVPATAAAAGAGAGFTASTTPASTPANTPALGTLAPDASASALPMLGGLLLVVALILGLGKLVKRLQATRGLGGKGPVMQLRGGIPLGGRERAVWMQAGDTHLLLGVSPGRVQMLHVFDVPPDFITTAATEAPAAVPANARSAALAVAPQAFSDRLKTLLAHAKAKGLDIETAAMETGMAEVATAAQVAPQAAPKVAVAKAAKPNFSFHA